MDENIDKNIQEASPSVTIVTFLIGESTIDLQSDAVLESKKLKSSPNYPDVIPKQKILKNEKYFLTELNKEINLLVKTCFSDMVIIESTVTLDNIQFGNIWEAKRIMLADCYKYLSAYKCNTEFVEEYSIYCVSNYEGDPEKYLSEYGDSIASLLKNEKIPLDEEEIKATLSHSLKYGKDDLTIVDWDGAFIFDPHNDFESNLELFEIGNLQLLKSRILDNDLDDRLEKTLDLLNKTKRNFFKSHQIRKVLKEIMQIRSESILESESIEKNIKLIGDWYSAKLFNLITKKFHLDEWMVNIDKKLDVLEDVYLMAAENFSISFRTTLEFVLIFGWFVLLLGWSILLYFDLQKM